MQRHSVCSHSSVLSIILDGEMLVWDPVTERHLPFGSLKTAALDKDKSKKELRPRPCCQYLSGFYRCQLFDSRLVKIFDVLLINGQSLINKTVVARKKNMRAYVSEVQGRMEYVTEFEGMTAKDVRMRMDEIMENRSVQQPFVKSHSTDEPCRGEGLILKHPKGAYTLNGRNIDFVKVSYASWVQE